MCKCLCVLLTLLSSVCQFHSNRKYCNFHTEIYTQHKIQGRKVNDLQNGKHSRDFFDIWKLSWFYNNLMFFWGRFEIISWFEGVFLQKNEEQLLRFSFQQLILEVFFSITDWSKNVLKYLSMNDMGYSIFKKFSEILNHYESQNTNHATCICSR